MSNAAPHSPGIAREAQPHVQWNFWMCVWNGAVVTMGTALFAAETVLAGLAYRLTESSFYVGLLISLGAIGWLWPQIMVGHFVESVRRKMPVYGASALIRFTSLLLMAAAVYAWDGPPMALYFILLALFTIFSSAGGVCVVPFMDIMAKTVPHGRIPMVLAYRRMFGGFLGVLAGALAAYILSARSGIGYPGQYALLILLGALLNGAAYYMFYSVREPADPSPPARTSFGAFLKRGPAIFRDDGDYRKLYFYRCVWAFGAMSQAVFVPFALDRLQAPESYTGWFAGVVMLSGGIAGILWGKAAQRHGEVRTLRWSAIVLFMAPLTALLLAIGLRLPGASSWVAEYYLWPCLFMFAVGKGAVHGAEISWTVYVLSLAPGGRRPTYVAFMNALTVPVLFAPTAAGYIAQRFSYEAAFTVSCAAALLALAIALRMRQRAPREPDGDGEHAA